MAGHQSTQIASELPTTLLERIFFFQELLIRHATGSREDDALYRELRRELVLRRDLESLVPSFLQSCRTLSGFWSWIKGQAGQYEPRRAIIREAFADLLDHLEHSDVGPADAQITAALASYDEESVRSAWSKALERRRDDPEGAITSARTLLETVCKKVLDDTEEYYDDNADLPKLYNQAAANLTLAPDLHTEKVFKSILGGCQNIVNSLGTLRNRLGDAYGKGRKRVRPSSRHAALAVNLAGSMALFLIETSQARRMQEQLTNRKLLNEGFIHYVLQKIAVSKIVGRYVHLKTAGKEWKGLSPFKEEPTPSFYVNDCNDCKAFYHCFNTGKHGSAVDFLVELEGISKLDAVKRVAEEAGVHVDDWHDEEQ